MKNLTSFRNTLFFFFSFSLSLSLSLSARPPATKRTKAMPPLSTSERNLSSLSGAHVFITGGASGIGAALADACAAGGAGAVSILDADARGAAAAAALLREGNPGLFAAAFACDVTSPEQVETISLESGEREGRGGEENGGGRERGRMTVRGDRGRARLFFFPFAHHLPPPKKKLWGKKKGSRRRPGRDRGPRNYLHPVRERRDRPLRAVPGGVRERRKRFCCGGGGSGGQLEEKGGAAAHALCFGGGGRRCRRRRRPAFVPLAEDHGSQLRGRRQRPPGRSAGDGLPGKRARRRDGVHG